MVRMATPADSAVCGRICFEAFSSVNAAHGFPCDFPGSEASTGLLSMMFASSDFYCAVAEVDGRIVGSNCLDERSLLCLYRALFVSEGDRRRPPSEIDTTAEPGCLNIRRPWPSQPLLLP